jgi:hypothetical protein
LPSILCHTIYLRHKLPYLASIIENFIVLHFNYLGAESGNGFISAFRSWLVELKFDPNRFHLCLISE